MTREAAIAAAETYFDQGGFKTDLARRVAFKTESQNPDRAGELARYLEAEMVPTLAKLGFDCRILTHAKAKGPFLLASRIEDPALPTVFGYGHGDVIRGLEDQWRAGLSPWELKDEGDRWYGRGTADNKGQHSINIGALAAVLATRGKLGFNAKYLIEMGEETGSPGLREVCEDNKALFAADMLLASDGPRLRAERPTIFLGSRGAFRISTSGSTRAKAAIIRAIGAASSPIPVCNSPTRFRPSRARPVRSAFPNGCRASCPIPCAARWPIARSMAAKTARRSRNGGASRG